MIASIWRELLGLFIDDGSLALGIVLWLAGGGICLQANAIPPEAEAVILCVGLLVLLAENVLRTTQALKQGGSP